MCADVNAWLAVVVLLVLFGILHDFLNCHDHSFVLPGRRGMPRSPVTLQGSCDQSTDSEDSQDTRHLIRLCEVSQMNVLLFASFESFGASQH